MSSCGWLEALLEAAAAQSITQLAAPRVGMKCDVHATAASARLDPARRGAADQALKACSGPLGKA